MKTKLRILFPVLLALSLALGMFGVLSVRNAPAALASCSSTYNQVVEDTGWKSNSNYHTINRTLLIALTDSFTNQYCGQVSSDGMIEFTATTCYWHEAWVSGQYAGTDVQQYDCGQSNGQIYTVYSGWVQLVNTNCRAVSDTNTALPYFYTNTWGGGC